MDITTDEIMFWNQWARLFPYNEAFKNRLSKAYPDIKIKVSKSQISFYNRHMFAMASPPVWRRKDWPTHVADGSLVMGNLMLAAHELGLRFWGVVLQKTQTERSVNHADHYCTRQENGIVKTLENRYPIFKAGKARRPISWAVFCL